MNEETRKKFKHIDPYTYKRPNKWLSASEYAKLKLLHFQKPNIPFETYKQHVLQTRYNIPSETTLGLMRMEKEGQTSSQKREDNPSIVEGRPGVYSPNPRGWQKGYEFKILK